MLRNLFAAFTAKPATAIPLPKPLPKPQNYAILVNGNSVSYKLAEAIVKKTEALGKTVVSKSVFLNFLDKKHWLESSNTLGYDAHHIPSAPLDVKPLALEKIMKHADLLARDPTLDGFVFCTPSNFFLKGAVEDSECSKKEFSFMLSNENLRIVELDDYVRTDYLEKQKNGESSVPILSTGKLKNGESNSKTISKSLYDTVIPVPLTATSSSTATTTGTGTAKENNESANYTEKEVKLSIVRYLKKEINNEPTSISCLKGLITQSGFPVSGKAFQGFKHSTYGYRSFKSFLESIPEARIIFFGNISHCCIVHIDAKNLGDDNDKVFTMEMQQNAAKMSRESAAFSRHCEEQSKLKITNPTQEEVRAYIVKLMKDISRGPTNLGTFKTLLKDEFSGFDEKLYGCDNFTEFCDLIPDIKLVWNPKANPSAAYCVAHVDFREKYVRRDTEEECKRGIIKFVSTQKGVPMPLMSLNQPDYRSFGFKSMQEFMWGIPEVKCVFIHERPCVVLTSDERTLNNFDIQTEYTEEDVREYAMYLLDTNEDITSKNKLHKGLRARFANFYFSYGNYSNFCQIIDKNHRLSDLFLKQKL